MLNFSDLALRRGPRLLFEHASFTIHAGNKVGLTGANGTGKSSLFALIRGELHADAGELSLPPHTVIAHVAQETPAVDRPALEYAIDGDAELRRIEQALQRAEQNNDGTLQASLHGQLDNIGGYAAPARAARLLSGLGFSQQQQSAPVSAFSGGWRMRLNLAQALMCRSDILLLDEPTNHLDLDAVLWLEDWLQGYPGTLLLISHDRDFLDRVVNVIAHIEQGGITLYTGNYTAFEAQRLERLAQQQAAHEKQQREIDHMQSFVDRFRAKATKAKQAQSRLKALERMTRIAPAHVDSPFHFSFRPAEKLPHPLLVLEDTTVGYDGKPLLAPIRFSLSPGARIGLLGPNGAGKSTLIKLLAGELAPLSGKRIPARYLQLGYFAQHQLEQLDSRASALLHLQRVDSKATEQSLRDYLGGFGFNGDRATDPVAPFSGGEKARLVLALLTYQRPNVLLLDEPTNHLDLEMRLALTLALQEYEGAMVIVSHDRHLLRTVTDEFYLVHDGKVAPFNGDLDDYRNHIQQHRNAETDGDCLTAQNPGLSRKDQRRQAADRRKLLQPLQNRLKKIERELARLETEKTHLETQLADSNLYADSNKDQLKQLLQQQASNQKSLAQQEEDWFMINEKLDDMNSD